MSRKLRRLDDLPAAHLATARAQLSACPRPKTVAIEPVVDVDLMPENGARFTVAIEPMGKPRMTQRDKWAKRPAVVRFREYADRLRAGCLGRPADPLRVSWRAYFTMPESWSKKKKDAMRGQAHRSKPDRDNVDKGILDSLWENDAGIASGEIAKFWDDGRGARLEITIE